MQSTLLVTASCNCNPMTMARGVADLIPPLLIADFRVLSQLMPLYKELPLRVVTE